ncbi:multidrug transporter AcrB [Desulfuromonas versatilis]|uniref:Multidrug transporter AcrB n=1 Tax=Desulfuromonas versatilis TaxID=2802975 RepID=A0ABN6DU27_9BACT|nr:efflux RND transporter permease subunit [Desulfuromonas versatilis]BCR03648.1 multidrug transporter AcrB [Desulfuromonas versatilis]
MNGPVRWMTHNHVAANLLMLVFIVGGLILGPKVKQEVFPEISLDRISISVPYPGAGPEEVEEGILLKIEENLTGVDGIKQIKSTAAEGVGTVMVEVREGLDADKVLQDVKSEVDRITTFPLDAEEPVISKLLNRREVISVVVYGELPERSLRERAEAVRDELLELPQITQVDLGGVRPYEISIEIPEQNLRRYNLTLEQVAQRVRRASLDLPGGEIKTSGGQILLRTKERRYLGPEYGDIAVLTNPDGTEVHLRDIAEVRDSFRETDEKATFDGMPAAMVKVFRVGEQKPTEISDLVIDYVAQKRGSLPPSVRLATWNDTSELFESRMNLLLKNAALGLVLVLITLGLFLEIRLALWVMLGIPISFFGTLFLMPAIGVSINMISLFAFILALGIVVDDAIVVGENIFEHRQMGKPFLQAAIDGTLEVSVPVVFAILTTLAAFSPLLFVSGLMGKFIYVIPAVVITILVVSLVECLFILPAHLAMGKRRQSPKGLIGAIDRVRLAFGRGLERFIAGPYRRTLNLCLRWRYVTIAAAIAVLFLSVGVIGGGILKFNFMPEVDADVITATLQMPRGTPVEQTSRVQEFIRQKAQETVEEFDRELPEGQSVLRHVYAVVGSSLAEGGPGGGAESPSGAHLADMAMFLTASEKRGISTTEIAGAWRKKVGEIPGIESLVFKSNLVRMGANIDIQLAHEDFAVLAVASERIKQELGNYPGVGDLEDTYARGKRELKIRLKPEGRTLGITEEDLGRQVRGAFYGAEALRLQRGRNEVKVMVRYPEDDRQSLWDFEALRLRTPQGGEVPLTRAAWVEEGRGFSEINRTDRKRVINVTASVDNRQANAGEILAELKGGLLEQLAHDYPGLSFNMEGEEKERRESMESMKTGFMLALLAIFALLAIPFRSYSQPLLIMAAIPFGVVGAIAGHLIMGYNLSILSMFGIVALSGVVVNDSLLLIDRINGNRREGGEDLARAVLDAGQRRFRPILLTSLTTFFGLAPMILETSVQAQFLIPMAISLGFGILFATGITLLLIPSLYLVLEDVRGLFGLRPAHADHAVEMEKAEEN